MFSSMLTAVAICFFAASSSQLDTASAFSVSGGFSSSARKYQDQLYNKNKESRLQVAHDPLQTSWSNSLASTSSSRFGVRNRVRQVLKKASARTGRSNRHSDAATVAEAAASGGLLHTDFSYKQSSSFFRNSTTTNLMVQPQTADAAPKVDTKKRMSINAVLNTGETNVLAAEEQANRVAEEFDEDGVEEEKPIELPFTLPTLSTEQLAMLSAGERIQEQSKMGREGSGYVVVDVDADEETAWESLLDFEKYQSYIGTVRDMRYKDQDSKNQERQFGQASTTRASFILSKFRLNVAAVHKYTPETHSMEFYLDSNSRNVVLQHAKGIWHTQQLSPNKTRVWLLCELTVSKLLPSTIVDYAAKRAMPRASAWIKPIMEENMMVRRRR